MSTYPGEIDDPNWGRTGGGALDAPDRAALVGALRESKAPSKRVRRTDDAGDDDQRRELVRDLLPVLDNLERACAAAAIASDGPHVNRLRAVVADFEAVLIRSGAERVDAMGNLFDPAIHDAIASSIVVDRRLVGRVVRQITPGYRFVGKVLRPAKVIVGAIGVGSGCFRMLRDT